jgi:hypothetical protein
MTDTPLDRLATKASADPAFLGFRLAAFAAAEGLDDAGLAARLGCEPAALTAVRLCLAPRPGANFREDVLCVAGKFGLDAVALAAAAKYGRVGAVRADAPAEPPGMILAARDREGNP